MSTRRFLASLVTAGAITIGALSTLPNGTASPAACAASLGISWTTDNGATERLDAFNACTKGSK